MFIFAVRYKDTKMNYINYYTAEYRIYGQKESLPAQVSLNESGFYYKVGEEEREQLLRIAEIVSIHTYNTYKVVLNFGDFPYQTLTCKDPAFLSEIKQQFKGYEVVDALSKSSKTTYIKYLLFLASFFIGLILFFYFVLVPWLVNKAVTHFPWEQEKKLGEMMYTKIKEQEKANPKKSLLLEHFFYQLCDSAQNPVQILFADNPVVNAYALPGGFIVINSGIVNQMVSPEELAGVLAHEYAHVRKKHTLKSMFNTLGFSVLLQLFLGSQDHSWLNAIGWQAQELSQLKYSRSLETEADEEAFKVLKNKSLNPHGLITLFSRLQENEKVNMPEILSTHPLPEDRIKKFNNLIEASPYPVIEKPYLELLFNQIKGK